MAQILGQLGMQINRVLGGAYSTAFEGLTSIFPEDLLPSYLTGEPMAVLGFAVPSFIIYAFISSD